MHAQLFLLKQLYHRWTLDTNTMRRTFIISWCLSTTYLLCVIMNNRDVVPVRSPLWSARAVPGGFSANLTSLTLRHCRVKTATATGIQCHSVVAPQYWHTNSHQQSYSKTKKMKNSVLVKKKCSLNTIELYF